MPERVLVVNPNCTASVTDGISAALEPLRRATDGARIDCITLLEGPPAIETDAHVASVVEPICRLVEREEAGADAFVIACYSDPGLKEARACTERPVFGMAESALLAAAVQTDRFGVISILEQSIPRHLRHARELGVDDKLAGDIAIDLGVLALADEQRTAERLLAVGERLRDEHGACTLILGCAGMAPHRAGLEAALGIPVIDPTLVAVGMALGAIRSGFANEPE